MEDHTEDRDQDEGTVIVPKGFYPVPSNEIDWDNVKLLNLPTVDLFSFDGGNDGNAKAETVRLIRRLLRSTVWRINSVLNLISSLDRTLIAEEIEMTVGALRNVSSDLEAENQKPLEYLSGKSAFRAISKILEIYRSVYTFDEYLKSDEDKNPEKSRLVSNGFVIDAAENIDRIKSYIQESLASRDKRLKRLNRIPELEIATATVELKEAKEQLEEQIKTVQQARKVTAGVGVDKYSEFFSEEAAVHFKEANQWRWSILICVVALIFVSGTVFYFEGPVKLDVPFVNLAALVLHQSPRIVVFSILFYLLFFCGRNYRISLHNYVALKQKSISLLTYDLFANGATDDSTHNGIILKTLDNILAPHTTGYISVDVEAEGAKMVIDSIGNAVTSAAKSK